MTPTFRPTAPLPTVLVLLILIIAAGCRTAPPPSGSWVGSADIGEGRSLPLRMHLDLGTTDPSGYFLVGPERTEIPSVRWTGDSLILTVSEYNAAVRLAWDGSRMTGRYERYRTDTTGFAVTASPETDGTASTPSAVPEIPLVGSFRVFWENVRESDTSWSAVFWARGDSVFGTLVAPSGDDGLFAGVQREDSVLLARFTGWQATLLQLTRAGADWAGVRYVRTNAPERFRVVWRPGATPALPASKQPRPADPARPFRFSGTTLTGDTLTEWSDRFRGKAMIVDIMGTWCHNCLDAAPVLQRLYEEFGPQGLEVVGLSFELTDDPVDARRNIGIFARRHDISYPILFAGDLSDENVSSRIRSQIDNFGAYPTALFIDRNGRVQAIHAGFRGPGTGDGFQEEVRYYYEKASLITSGGEKGTRP